MTFPRNKSRSIQIDGQPYRWMHGYYGPESPCFVAVHADREPHGEVLRTKVNIDVVTPGLVGDLVREAIKQGWTPGAGGGEFHLPATE